MIGRRLRIGPAIEVQVLVHQELAEGQEAKVNLVPLHSPSKLAGDSLLDGVEVGGEIEVLFGVDVGQGNAELGQELGLQGEIDAVLLACPLHLVTLTGISTLELHWHHDKRGHALLLGTVRLVPVQKAEGKIKRVDTRLLDAGPRE